MKVINEKGKLFGIINVVDLLVLLAVLAVVFGVSYKLFAPKVRELASPTVEMTVTLRVRGVYPFLLEQLKKDPQIGKQLVAGNNYIPGTEIIDSWVEDYVIQSTTADGRIVNSTDPSKKDVILIVKTTVAKGTSTPKIGAQEVRAGGSMILKTNTFETTANIDAVSFGE